MYGGLVNASDDSSQRIDQLTGQVTQLQQLLRQIESEQVLLARRRRRHLMIVGVGLSMVVHICLMVYLATHYRAVPGGRAPQQVNYEFAILQEEELTELESTELDDLIPEVASEMEDLPANDPAAELDPVVPAAELEVTRTGAMPTLGGSGDGDGAGGSLTGGGAGASFFGVSSRGMRFAYIVDRSGSMQQNQKLRIAMQELARSISSLPDYASFHVLMFSDGFIEPPMQRGWMRARKSNVNRFIRWLNSVSPTGGTQPLSAFQHVFSLDVRPDVVFFLTDGQIPQDTADLVADLNRHGGRVIINTIAFGDPTSQEQLKRMARASGGVYRFVSAEGR
jgi:hypothetical protein